MIVMETRRRVIAAVQNMKAPAFMMVSVMMNMRG